MTDIQTLKKREVALREELFYNAILQEKFVIRRPGLRASPRIAKFVETYAEIMICDEPGKQRFLHAAVETFYEEMKHKQSMSITERENYVNIMLETSYCVDNCEPECLSTYIREGILFCLNEDSLYRYHIRAIIDRDAKIKQLAANILDRITSHGFNSPNESGVESGRKAVEELLGLRAGQ